MNCCCDQSAIPVHELRAPFESPALHLVVPLEKIAGRIVFALDLDYSPYSKIGDHLAKLSFHELKFTTEIASLLLRFGLHLFDNLRFKKSFPKNKDLIVLCGEILPSNQFEPVERMEYVWIGWRDIARC